MKFNHGTDRRDPFDHAAADGLVDIDRVAVIQNDK